MTALRHASPPLAALLAALAAAGPCPAAAQGGDAPMLPPPPADAPPRPAPPGPDSAAPLRRTVSGPAVAAAGWCPRPDPTRYPADHDPQVVDSYPSEGATVPPGAATVRVTFDAAMSCDWNLEVEGGDSPPCAKAGAWALPARRTYLTRCSLAPGTRYTFHFRGGNGGFVGLSGRPAEGFDLSFDTSDGPPAAIDAPSADPRPPAGETVKAYVACLDRGPVDGPGACQKVLVDPAGPPQTP